MKGLDDVVGWRDAVRRALAEEGACVLVSLARARGSTPREAGAKMVVWADGFAGSIGGGNLEYVALQRARRLLQAGEGCAPHFEEFSLGPSLAQCCGGSAGMLFEPLAGPPPFWLAALDQAAEKGEAAVLFTPLGGRTGQKVVATVETLATADLDPKARKTAVRLLESGQPGSQLKRDASGSGYLLEAFVPRVRDLYLFGAGHVGRALVPLLAALAFHVTWVDERPLEFPETIPANTRPRALAVPLEAVGQAPAGALYLVMTHSHQLDLALCEQVLRRGDFRYLGLIGSASKRARFERRLRDGGIAQSDIDRLTCPIGVPGIPGKTPAEIATGVAAQLLQV
jgi:xanthine dehydrogenase accessory factor